MKNLTPEMIEKAKAAKSAEELLALAKANNIEMTADEAATYFSQLNPKSGELSDDDLDSVAGGACASESQKVSIGTIVRITSGQTCCKCGSNTGRVQIVGDYGIERGVVCTNPSCNYCDIACLNCCTFEVIG